MKFIVIALVVLAALTSAMKTRTKTSACGTAPFTDDECLNTVYNINQAYFEWTCAATGNSFNQCVFCCSDMFCNAEGEYDGDCGFDTSDNCIQGILYDPCIYFCQQAPTCPPN